MRPITILILAVLTVATVVAAISAGEGRRGIVEVARGERLFPTLGGRIDQVRSIEIVRADGKVMLTRDGDGWALTDKQGFPARVDHVRRLLASIAELETLEAKTRTPALHERLDLSEVDAPGAKSARVVLKDGQGAAIADLVVGKRRVPPAGAQPMPTGMDMIYVRKADDPQSWLALGQIDLRKGALEWADRDILDLGPTKFARVVVDRVDGAGFELIRGEGDTRDFRLDAPPEGRKIKSQFDLNGIGAFLESLSVDDVMRAPGTLPTPTVVGRWIGADGLTVTVRLVSVGDQPWIAFAVAGEGAAAEAAKPIAARVDGWLFKLPDWKRERLEATKESLLDKPAAPAG